MTPACTRRPGPVGLLGVRPQLRGSTQGSSPQSTAECRGGWAAVHGPLCMDTTVSTDAAALLKGGLSH